ncbi:MAG: hypothetical protein LAP21_26550, partial [Acidobacteriia bacterium]|nr:hypothetical protein [Terriglobia bacterium]
GGISTHMNWGWLGLRLALGLTVLALLVLSQRFWHRGVWRLTRRIGRPWLRAGTRSSSSRSKRSK